MPPGRVVTRPVAIGPVTFHTCRIMRTLTTFLVFALTASGPGFALQAQSDVGDELGPPMHSAMQSDGADLDEAVEQVRRQCNGRIISAVTKRKGNREIHEIKCLTQEGTVRTFRVPGKQLS